MQRKHESHEQRKSLTRERLLAAAREVFIEKGFASASVQDIVEAAGYTRGAFYSSFGNKATILLELLRRDHDRTLAHLHAIQQLHSTRAGIESRCVTDCCRFIYDSDCFPLWVDAMLLAMRETHMRDDFNALCGQKLEQIRAYIGILSNQTGMPLGASVESLALGLLSLCEGLQFLRLCDPETVSDEATQANVGRYLGDEQGKRNVLS
ncbi:hypothetical protein DSC91_006893 [Paraburkholderia caffeinilytica]|uniref:TetR family transcriptional regulator n=1 Tax=Paraburkholderia caffeinilytica TaxID=1761016 RepID=A0ABQ1LSL9_9BURK|nr:TetR/AcrR family transcriptional regulator [Paraburkholderia caffeinilytica]AXL53460.1 hypothetical protein DSC91_006893 [Paraburkholderia caffeinilytica]GGC29253.1 TetR family transcriptional regulator [Paraburkholderia caffeinilytica]